MRVPQVRFTIRRMIVAVAAVAVAVTMIGALVVMVKSVRHREEPYRMSLSPADGRSVVRFSRPSRGLVSPPFEVDLPLREGRVITLSSERASIPGGQIEFSDTTFLPGRFQIRMAGSFFDVMERGLIVNGKDVEWLRAERRIR